MTLSNLSRSVQCRRVNISCERRNGRATLRIGVHLQVEAVKNQRPIATEGEHRVLQFRPRSAQQPPAVRAPVFHGNAVVTPLHHESPFEPAHLSSLDLSRYETPREEPDDFRHRMLANIAAFAFTVALTAVAIWLAMSIADLRRTQDCVLMGRHDCVRISAQ